MDPRIEKQNEFIILFAVLGLIFLCIMHYVYSTQKAKERLEKEPPTLQVFIAMAAIAFIIRLLIGYNMPGYISDVDCFRSWSVNAFEGGLQNFYSGEFFADYPPLYIYFLGALGFIRDVAGVDAASPEFGLLVRLPALITDILLAAFVYSVAKKEMNGKSALFLSALILFNPAIMANNALWGQVDVIVTLFMVFTIYLLYKDKLFFSAILFVLALLLKPQAVMIAPILLFVFVRNIVVSKKKLQPILTLVISLAAIVGLFLLVPLPFGVNKEPLWLIQRYSDTMGQYPQTSLNAFNLYSMLGLNFLSAQDFSFLGLPLNRWGFIFICMICVYALWLYIKKPDKRFLFALSALIVMGVYAFAHGMHERYIFVVPILLLFAYILMRDKRLFTCTILLFGVSLVNTCVSLYYYQIWIPTELIVVLSVISMAAYLYTIYVITMIALKPVKLLEPKPAPVVESSAKAPAQMRLENFSQKKHITRKDGLFMLIISAVYACVAFINLGAFQIPQTSAAIADNTFIEFEQQQQISRFQYYADYGQGGFDVYTSNDGENYSPVELQKDGETLNTVKHEKGDLYKWRSFDVNIDAKYLQFVPVWEEDLPPEQMPSLPILEMAFYDAAGNKITPLHVFNKDTMMNELVDEQNLVPAERSYMNEFYFDELYHVRTAYENIHGITPYEITHPPLGKIIIASGIQMFGMNPFGWRFMGTLVGVLMLPLIYILAKLMLKKTRYAVMATVLLAVDFMHFAQTRIGTVDSFSILWILLMYLFMYQFTQRNFNRQPLKKTLVPLFLCGLSFGLGAATKWLCIYAAFGLLAIYVITMYRRHSEYKFAQESGLYPEIVRNYKRNLRITLLCSVLFFLIIPAFIYVVSYAPYFMVTDGGAYTGLSDIIGNQKYMLNYHSTLDPEYVHPFASMWYTWPADVRPVLFFSQQNAANNTISTLSTMGNPLIWWTGIVAVVYLVVNAIRSKRHRSFELLFLAIAALSQFMPWWFVSREVFIYHYFATVPFLILLIVYWLENLAKDFKYGKVFGFAFVAACVVFFVLFYPVITGVPADAGYVTSLRWLESWPFY